MTIRLDDDEKTATPSSTTDSSDDKVTFHNGTARKYWPDDSLPQLSSDRQLMHLQLADYA